MIKPTYALGSDEATEVLRSLGEGEIGAGICIGFDGCVKFANDAACKMFGFKKEEVVNHRCAAVFGQFEEFHMVLLDTVENQEGIERKVKIESPSGVARSFSVTTSYLTEAKSEGPAGIFAVLDE